jgi:hypothetical protein
MVKVLTRYDVDRLVALHGHILAYHCADRNFGDYCIEGVSMKRVSRYVGSSDLLSVRADREHNGWERLLQRINMLNEMNNLELWGLVVGFLLPPVLAVVQQSKWSDKLRSSVGFIACIVAAGVATYLEHGLHLDEHFVRVALLTLVAAQTTYRNFWKPVGIAPAIEKRTNVGGTKRRRRRRSDA